MPLQYRRIFDRRSLLVNLQRELGIEPQHFCRLGPRLRFFTQLTVDRCQGEMGTQNIGVAGEILLQRGNRLLRPPGQVISNTYAV